MAFAAAPGQGCQVAGNLVGNCGFPTDLSGWTTIFGTCVQNGSDGSSAVGNANCTSAASFDENVSLRRCVDGISPSTVYNYGFDVQRVSGDPAAVNCRMAWTTLDAVGCGGTALDGGFTGFFPPGSGSYAQSSSASFNSGVGALSVTITVQCQSPNGSPFVTRFDDIFVGSGLTPVELHSYSVE